MSFVASPQQLAQLTHDWQTYKQALGPDWTPSYYFAGMDNGLYAFPSSQWDQGTSSPLHTVPGQEGEVDPRAGLNVAGAPSTASDQAGGSVWDTFTGGSGTDSLMGNGMGDTLQGSGTMGDNLWNFNFDPAQLDPANVQNVDLGLQGWNGGDL